MKKTASKPIIAVVGTKNFGTAVDGNSLPKNTRQVSRAIGKEIAQNNCWLLCGGLTGVMEAVAKGAKDGGGYTIGIIPQAIYEISNNDKDEWPNRYIDVAIFTGLHGRRNEVIVNSCDVLIALPGSNRKGKGTRSEIDFAILKKVPVILHKYWRGVDNSITEDPPLIQYFKNARDAVDKALQSVINRNHATTSRR